MTDDEVIDLLRQRQQRVPVPLELPDEDRLVEVEEELLLPIPRDMRRFLLEVSDVVYGTLEPVTAADAQSHTYLSEVAAQAWDEGLPRHLLPLCYADGGYYCVTSQGEVNYWRDGEFDDEEWESVWAWAEDVWLKTGD